MNHDLKVIKKKYGEEMMHLCRELFPTLLETEGLLPTLLMRSFKESHSIAQDIKNHGLKADFKDIIYSFVDVEQDYKLSSNSTPEELLGEVGYQLYECHTEEEIQSFKKYYAPREKLCTFHGNRLEHCHVFFAVKENVEEIKRENFKKPKRQDEYGTSVISIQFTRDSSHTLSIKNRYNHSVNFPDSTFGNNLDNIIPGLTDSFAQYYGMTQSCHQNRFELPGYVKAKDGKFYKYNYESYNIYYCENNIIIDNFEVREYPKERYVIFDYFILDLQTKKIKVYDEDIQDSFPDTIGEIERIGIKRQPNGKLIEIYEKDSEEPILLGLDQCNRIISLVHNHVQDIPDEFLPCNKTMERIELSNVIEIGNGFLRNNIMLEKVELPNVIEIGNRFLEYNMKLRSIVLPKAEMIGDSFLCHNRVLEKVELPNVVKIGNGFLHENEKLRSIVLPKVEIIGYSFLYNSVLEKVELPNVIEIGNRFLEYNMNLRSIVLPKAEMIGDSFLCHNRVLEKVELPNVVKIGNVFLDENEKLRSIVLPKVEIIGYNFLCDSVLEKVELPNAVMIGSGFLGHNMKLRSIELPKVKIIEHSFLRHNRVLEKVELPNVIEIGSYFLEENEMLLVLKLPNVVKIRNNCLYKNKKLRIVELPNVFKIKNGFLFYNEELLSIELLNVAKIGDDCLSNNEKLQSIVFPNLKSYGKKFCQACNHLVYVYTPLLPELEEEMYFRPIGGKKYEL